MIQASTLMSPVTAPKKSPPGVELTAQSLYDKCNALARNLW
jgi:hypothetical protein